MGHYGGLSGRAHIGAIIVAIFAVVLSVVILSGPVVVEVWAEDATTDTTSTLAAAKKVAKKKDDGLLFRGSDPIGLAVPKEITAEYGISGGLSPGKSETGEAKDYIDSYAQRQLARAEARARGYALDFTTSQFEAAGKRYLGERFRVFSSLLWTEENRFRGSLTVVAPLRESGRGVTFLQPGVIFWNGKSVSGKRDARTDYSLGLVHRVRASGGGYFGGSVFLDSGRYSHQRLGLGLDYQIHQTRLSVNYYLPLTDAETGFSGFRERALRGYDFTLEQGYGQRFVLTATGGIWESTGTDVSSGSSKSLFKTDAKYLVNDIVSLRGGYEWADDNTNVTDGYNVGVDVQLPGGGNGFSGGFEADLWAPVKREARILVSRDEGGAAAKRELASGATRELLSLVGADGRDVRGVGITRPVDGVTGAESIRVTLGPGATVYYAVDWEVGLSAAADGGGVAREGGDSAADDYFAHSVVGVGVDLDNVDGSGNCITVEQSAENSVFNINLRIHGNSSASGKLIHISLKPVVNAAACSAAGGSTQGLSTIEVSASGLIDIRIPLSAGQNGSYARYVSLRALDGSGALVTSSSVLTLDGTNDPQSFRVYVSDAAGAAVSTPLPTGVTFEVVLDFESDTESLGDTYSVARDGSDLAAVADERYLLTFSGETVSHDFGVSLGDPKRQLAEVGVRLEGVATSGSSVVAGFGVSGGAALDELTLRLAPTAVVAADDIVTVVYFSESATLLAENGTLAIELNRDPAPASAAALAVGYEVIAGSASSGDDYTVADGSLSVSFAGVATTANITIPLVDDSDEELSETLTVRLIDSTDNSYVLGGVSEHLVTIVDDDVRLLWFGADSVSVTEAGTSSDITLTLTLSSAAPTGGLEVPLLVGHRGDSATLGLANAGGDYSVSGTTAPTGGGQRHMVDIAAGSTTAVVLVSLHNDTLVEGSETFTLRLAPVAAGGGYALDASRSDVLFVTILDGDLSADETSSATFELVAAGDANIGEGSTPPDLSAGAEPFNRVKLGLAGAGLTLERTLTFAVTLSADNTGGRLSVPESVTILAGSGSAEIPLTITDDQIINGAAKTFTLTVSPAAALGQRPLVTADGAGNARVATENYEIADDDRALLVVEGVPARVLEGVSPLPTFTLTTDREFGAVAGTAAQVSLTVTGLGGASATGDAGNSVSLAVRPVGGSALATLTGDSAGSDQSATFTLPAITAEGTKPSLEVVITAPDELFGGGEQEIGLVFSLVSLVAPASYVLGTNTNEDLYQARDVSASFIFVDGDASLDITSPSSLRFTEGVATSVGIELNQALGAAVPFVVKVLSGGSPLAGFVDVPGTIAAGGTTARVSVTVPGDGTLGKSGRSLTLRVEETGAGVSALVGDDKEVAISVLNGDRADLVVYIEDGTDNTTVMPNEVLAGTNYSRGESGSFSSGLPSGTPLRLALLLVPAGSDARDSGGKVAGLEVFGDVTLPVNAPPSSSTTIADISGVKFYDTNGVAITSYPYDVEFLTFGVGSLPLTYQDNVIGGPGTDDGTGIATGFTIGTLKGGAAGFVRNREFLRSVVIDNAEEDDGGALTGTTVRTLVEVRDASNPLGARAQVQGLYRLEFTGTSGATLGADWSVGLNFAPLVSGGTRHTIRLSDGASGAGSDSTLCAASNARFALSSATGTDGSRGGLVTFDAGASSGVACILVSFDGAASDGGSTSVEVASQKGAILNSADVPDSFISPRITDTGLATSLTIDDADAFSPSFSIETSTGALPSLSGSGDTQTFSEADLPADRAMKLTFAAPTGPIPGLAAGETAAFTPSVVVSGSTSLVSTASLGADAVVYTQPSGGAAATANVTELPFTFLNNDLWAANDYVQEERKFTARLLLGTRPADAQVRGRQITYTITDDEADEADIAFGSTAGVPTAHTAEVAEEAGATTLTVPITIDQSPLTATTFSIEVDTAASTAVAGTDYAVATLPTATFAAKTATLTQNLSIVVTPVDNNDAAPAKTIVIKVSDSAANSLGRHYTRNNTAVITLKDDDTGKITISNTNITVSESAGRVSIPLSYTGSPISGGEVATIATSYANVADSDAGVVSALTVDDYISPPSHSVAFVATASPPATADISFPITNDRIIEGPGKLTVTLDSLTVNPTSGNAKIDAANKPTATVTVTDDDTGKLTGEVITRITEGRSGGTAYAAGAYKFTWEGGAPSGTFWRIFIDVGDAVNSAGSGKTKPIFEWNAVRVNSSTNGMSAVRSTTDPSKLFVIVFAAVIDGDTITVPINFSSATQADSDGATTIFPALTFTSGADFPSGAALAGPAGSVNEYMRDNITFDLDDIGVRDADVFTPEFNLVKTATPATALPGNAVNESELTAVNVLSLALTAPTTGIFGAPDGSRVTYTPRMYFEGGSFEISGVTFNPATITYAQGSGGAVATIANPAGGVVAITLPNDAYFQDLGARDNIRGNRKFVVRLVRTSAPPASLADNEKEYTINEQTQAVLTVTALPRTPKSGQEVTFGGQLSHPVHVSSGGSIVYGPPGGTVSDGGTTLTLSPAFTGSFVFADADGNGQINGGELFAATTDSGSEVKWTPLDAHIGKTVTFLYAPKALSSADGNDDLIAANFSPTSIDISVVDKSVAQIGDILPVGASAEALESGSVVVPITLNADTSIPTTVNLTATLDSDPSKTQSQSISYTAAEDASAVIKRATFNLGASPLSVGDNRVNSATPRTLTITAAADDTGNSEVATTPATAKVTILDDEAALARVAFGNSASSTTSNTVTFTEGNADTTANASITVSHLPDPSASFPIAATSAVTDGATSGIDFVLSSSAVAVTNTLTENLPLTITADDIIEPTETFTLAFQAPASPAVSISDFYRRNNSLTVSITDTDTGLIDLTYNSPNEATNTPLSGNLTATLRSGKTAAKDITINWGTDGTPSDFTGGSLPSGTITIIAGNNAASISAGTFGIAQSASTGNTFNFTIGSLVTSWHGTRVQPGEDSGDVSIVDVTRVILSADISEIDEKAAAGAVVRLTVSLNRNLLNVSPDTGATIAVVVTMPAGLTAPTVADVVYAELEGTAAVFPTFTIPAGIDNATTGDQTITITATPTFADANRESSGEVSADPVTVTITVKDDESTLSFKNLVANIDENAAAPLDIPVVLTGTLTTATTVTGTLTVAGTATSGADFVALLSSFSLAFPIATNPEATLSLDPITDALIEGAETVIITLATVDAPFALSPNVATLTTTVTIADTSNASLMVGFDGGNTATIIEGNDEEFTLSLNGLAPGQSSSETQVRLVVTPGTPPTDTADVVSSLTLKLPPGLSTAGNSVSIPFSDLIPAASQVSGATGPIVLDDAIAEGQKSFMITLESVSGHTPVDAARNILTVTLYDDDISLVILDENDALLPEDSEGVPVLTASEARTLIDPTDPALTATIVPVTFSVALTDPAGNLWTADRDISFDYQVDGSPATEYTLRSGTTTLTGTTGTFPFTTGQSKARGENLSVQAVDDIDPEGDQFFTYTLSPTVASIAAATGIPIPEEGFKFRVQIEDDEGVVLNVATTEDIIEPSTSQNRAGAQDGKVKFILSPAGYDFGGTEFKLDLTVAKDPVAGAPTFTPEELVFGGAAGIREIDMVLPQPAQTDDVGGTKYVLTLKDKPLLSLSTEEERLRAQVNFGDGSTVTHDQFGRTVTFDIAVRDGGTFAPRLELTGGARGAGKAPTPYTAVTQVPGVGTRVLPYIIDERNILHVLGADGTPTNMALSALYVALQDITGGVGDIPIPSTATPVPDNVILQYQIKAYQHTTDDFSDAGTELMLNIGATTATSASFPSGEFTVTSTDEGQTHTILPADALDGGNLQITFGTGIYDPSGTDNPIWGQDQFVTGDRYLRLELLPTGYGTTSITGTVADAVTAGWVVSEEPSELFFVIEDAQGGQVTVISLEHSLEVDGGGDKIWLPGLPGVITEGNDAIPVRLRTTSPFGIDTTFTLAANFPSGLGLDDNSLDLTLPVGCLFSDDFTTPGGTVCASPVSLESRSTDRTGMAVSPSGTWDDFLSPTVSGKMELRDDGGNLLYSQTVVSQDRFEVKATEAAVETVLIPEEGGLESDGSFRDNGRGGIGYKLVVNDRADSGKVEVPFALAVPFKLSFGVTGDAAALGLLEIGNSAVEEVMPVAADDVVIPSSSVAVSGSGNSRELEFRGFTVPVSEVVAVLPLWFRSDPDSRPGTPRLLSSLGPVSGTGILTLDRRFEQVLPVQDNGATSLISFLPGTDKQITIFEEQLNDSTFPQLSTGGKAVPDTVADTTSAGTGADGQTDRDVIWLQVTLDVTPSGIGFLEDLTQDLRGETVWHRTSDTQAVYRLGLNDAGTGFQTSATFANTGSLGGPAIAVEADGNPLGFSAFGQLNFADDTQASAGGRYTITLTLELAPGGNADPSGLLAGGTPAFLIDTAPARITIVDDDREYSVQIADDNLHPGGPANSKSGLFQIADGELDAQTGVDFDLDKGSDVLLGLLEGSSHVVDFTLTGGGLPAGAEVGRFDTFPRPVYAGTSVAVRSVDPQLLNFGSGTKSTCDWTAASSASGAAVTIRGIDVRDDERVGPHEPFRFGGVAGLILAQCGTGVDSRSFKLRPSSEFPTFLHVLNDDISGEMTLSTGGLIETPAADGIYNVDKAQPGAQATQYNYGTELEAPVGYDLRLTGSSGGLLSAVIFRQLTSDGLARTVFALPDPILEIEAGVRELTQDDITFEIPSQSTITAGSRRDLLTNLRLESVADGDIATVGNGALRIRVPVSRSQFTLSWLVEGTTAKETSADTRTALDVTRAQVEDQAATNEAFILRVSRANLAGVGDICLLPVVSGVGVDESDIAITAQAVSERGAGTKLGTSIATAAAPTTESPLPTGVDCDPAKGGVWWKESTGADTRFESMLFFFELLEDEHDEHSAAFGSAGVGPRGTPTTLWDTVPSGSNRSVDTGITYTRPQGFYGEQATVAFLVGNGDGSFRQDIKVTVPNSRLRIVDDEVTIDLDFDKDEFGNPAVDEDVAFDIPIRLSKRIPSTRGGAGTHLSPGLFRHNNWFSIHDAQEREYVPADVLRNRPAGADNGDIVYPDPTQVAAPVALTPMVLTIREDNENVAGRDARGETSNYGQLLSNLTSFSTEPDYSPPVAQRQKVFFGLLRKCSDSYVRCMPGTDEAPEWLLPGNLPLVVSVNDRNAPALHLSLAYVDNDNYAGLAGCVAYTTPPATADECRGDNLNTATTLAWLFPGLVDRVGDLDGAPYGRAREATGTNPNSGLERSSQGVDFAIYAELRGGDAGRISGTDYQMLAPFQTTTTRLTAASTDYPLAPVLTAADVGVVTTAEINLTAVRGIGSSAGFVIDESKTYSSTGGTDAPDATSGIDAGWVEDSAQLRGRALKIPAGSYFPLAGYNRSADPPTQTFVVGNAGNVPWFRTFRDDATEGNERVEIGISPSGLARYGITDVRPAVLIVEDDPLDSVPFETVTNDTTHSVTEPADGADAVVRGSTIRFLSSLEAGSHLQFSLTMSSETLASFDDLFGVRLREEVGAYSVEGIRGAARVDGSDMVVDGTFLLPEVSAGDLFVVELLTEANGIVSPDDDTGVIGAQVDLVLQLESGGGLVLRTSTGASGELAVKVTDNEADQTWQTQNLYIQSSIGGLRETFTRGSSGSFGLVEVDEGSLVGFGFEISGGKSTGQSFGILYGAFGSDVTGDVDATAADFVDPDVFNAAVPTNVLIAAVQVSNPVSTIDSQLNFPIRSRSLIARGVGSGVLLADNDVIETARCRVADLLFRVPSRGPPPGGAMLEFPRILPNDNAGITNFPANKVESVNICDNDTAELEFANRALGTVSRGSGTTLAPQGLDSGRFDVVVGLSGGKTAETDIDFTLTFGDRGAGYDDFQEAALAPTVWVGGEVAADGTLLGLTSVAATRFTAGTDFVDLDGAGAGNEVELKVTLPAGRNRVVVRLVPVEDDNFSTSLTMTLATGALPDRITLSSEVVASGGLEEKAGSTAVVMTATTKAGDFEFGEGEPLSKVVNGVNYGLKFALFERDETSEAKTATPLLRTTATRIVFRIEEPAGLSDGVSRAFRLRFGASVLDRDHWVEIPAGSSSVDYANAARKSSPDLNAAGVFAPDNSLVNDNGADFVVRFVRATRADRRAAELANITADALPATDGMLTETLRDNDRSGTIELTLTKENGDRTINASDSGRVTPSDKLVEVAQSILDEGGSASANPVSAGYILTVTLTPAPAQLVSIPMRFEGGDLLTLEGSSTAAPTDILLADFDPVSGAIQQGLIGASSTATARFIPEISDRQAEQVFILRTAPGVGEYRFVLRARDDNVAEPDETSVLTPLLNAVSASFLGVVSGYPSSTGVSVTVKGDPLEFAVTSSGGRVTEGNAVTYTLTPSYTPNAASSLWVEVARTAPGASTRPVENNTGGRSYGFYDNDVTSVTGLVTGPLNTGGRKTFSYAAGAASRAFVVTTTDDNIIEEDETLIMTFGSSAAGVTFPTGALQGLIIEDNDSGFAVVTTTGAAPSARGIANPLLTEGGTDPAIEIVLQASSSDTTPRRASLALAYPQSIQSTELTAGSDIAGTLPRNFTLTVPAGQSKSNSETIDFHNDTLVERDENFLILEPTTFASPYNRGDALRGISGTAISELTDDDADRAKIRVQLLKGTTVITTAEAGTADLDGVKFRAQLCTAPPSNATCGSAAGMTMQQPLTVAVRYTGVANSSKTLVIPAGGSMVEGTAFDLGETGAGTLTMTVTLRGIATEDGSLSAADITAAPITVTTPAPIFNFVVSSSRLVAPGPYTIAQGAGVTSQAVFIFLSRPAPTGGIVFDLTANTTGITSDAADSDDVYGGSKTLGTLTVTAGQRVGTATITISQTAHTGLQIFNVVATPKVAGAAVAGTVPSVVFRVNEAPLVYNFVDAAGAGAAQGTPRTWPYVHPLEVTGTTQTITLELNRNAPQNITFAMAGTDFVIMDPVVKAARASFPSTPPSITILKGERSGTTDIVFDPTKHTGIGSFFVGVGQISPNIASPDMANGVIFTINAGAAPTGAEIAFFPTSLTIEQGDSASFQIINLPGGNPEPIGSHLRAVGSSPLLPAGVKLTSPDGSSVIGPTNRLSDIQAPLKDGDSVSILVEVAMDAPAITNFNLLENDPDPGVSSNYLYDAGGGNIEHNATLPLTITTAAPILQFGATPAPIEEDLSPKVLNIPVTLSAALGTASTVNLVFGTDGDSATFDAVRDTGITSAGNVEGDYRYSSDGGTTLTGTTFTIPAGQTTFNLPLTIVNTVISTSSVTEPPEVFVITMNAIGSAPYVIGSKNSVAVTITDSATNGFVMLISLVAASDTGTEITSVSQGDSVRLKASLVLGSFRSAKLELTVPVTVTPADFGGAWGTTAHPPPFTITANTNTAFSAPFTIASSASGATRIPTPTFAPDVGTFTSPAKIIQPPEIMLPAPLPILQFGATPAPFEEESAPQTLNIPVTLSAALGTASTVNLVFGTDGDSATVDAVRDTGNQHGDYRYSGTTFAIPKDVTSFNLPITITDTVISTESVAEPSEVFVVTMNAIGSAPYVIGSKSSVAVTITDSSTEAYRMKISLVAASGTTDLTSVNQGDSVRLKAIIIFEPFPTVKVNVTVPIAVTPADFTGNWGTTAHPAPFTIAARADTAFSAPFTIASSSAGATRIPTPTFAPDVGGFTSPADIVQPLPEITLPAPTQLEGGIGRLAPDGTEDTVPSFPTLPAPTFGTDPPDPADGDDTAGDPSSGTDPAGDPTTTGDAGTGTGDPLTGVPIPPPPSPDTGALLRP